MKILDYLNRGLDLIYSRICISCGDTIIGSCIWDLCVKCRNRIQWLHGIATCKYCSIPIVSSSVRRDGQPYVCINCIKSPPPFNETIAGGVYKGPLKDAIQAFKYKKKGRLGYRLTRQILNLSHVKSFLYVHSELLLLPVPLYKKRLREREFNQSAIICKAITDVTSNPLLLGILKKTRDTPPQVGLQLKERAHNIRGTFMITNASIIKGKSIMLVDDVYTTGATLKECAITLKKAGAARIYIFTLARAITPGRTTPTP